MSAVGCIKSWGDHEGSTDRTRRSRLGSRREHLTTLWTNRQHRQDLVTDRLTERQEEASREIRKSLIAIHHLKHTLPASQDTSGPDELLQLVHTIDTYTLVLASAELRARLDGATRIMWMWHILSSRNGHPVWIACNDATACIGAYLRAEVLPEEPDDVRSLIEQVEMHQQHDEFE
jgi:hypothetical protein